MNWLRRRLWQAVPRSTDEWLLMAAALVLVLVMLVALLAGAATPPSAIISFGASLTVLKDRHGSALADGELA